MNFKYLGAILTVSAMSLVHATPVTFSLTGSNSVGTLGNVRTFTDAGSGLTATATSWSTATSASSAAFMKAATGRWGGGLGVCNTISGSEGTAAVSGAVTGCTSPNHAMDNSGRYDFILFQFNQAVDPLSLRLSAYSTGDSDISYWTGNTATSTTLLVSKTLGGLGALGFGNEMVDLDNTATNPRTAYLVSGNVNSLLIAARLDAAITGRTTSSTVDPRDYMKVGSLTVDHNPVPEPATMGLLGLALAGLGVLRTRKRS